MTKPFVITQGPLHIVSVMHYTMELAAHVRRAFLHIKPDCVAVELPANLQDEFLLAAARLPDVSVVLGANTEETLAFPVEPCDASFEALRSAHETNTPAFCIDLDVLGYPIVNEPLPDAFAITKIGLKKYYEIYASCNRNIRTQFDQERELHMAKRLRELSFSYEKILVVVGMAHVQSLLAHTKDSSYPEFQHVTRKNVSLVTYPEEAVRELLAECGWVSSHYEKWRQLPDAEQTALNRHKLHLTLIQEAKKVYEEKKQQKLPPHSIAQLFTFARNLAYIRNQLLPDIFDLITASKACVDHNFAYEVWKLATEYPFYKNVDSLPERDFSIDDLWKSSKKLHFHLKHPSEKSLYERRLAKEKAPARLYPPNFFSICSYPPEDTVIEAFGHFLKKKGELTQLEEAMKTVVFSTSLEDGIDVKETIRHWPEKKLYVKSRGKPPGQVGSCVVVFDEESRNETLQKYPSTFTWIGEHDQESDMAFYASSMKENIVGPGIVKCQYGGFLLSFPNRRLFEVWQDPDYFEFEMKHDVLLAASIDYSRRPVIVYAGIHPPKQSLKTRAARQGKKILYMPLSSFPKREIAKLKTFHILDGHDKRKIADEYIY